MKIEVTVSNRHIHLSQEDAKILFGNSFSFCKMQLLNQKSDYISKNIVEINILSKVKKKLIVIGPCRILTQVELLFSDVYMLNEIPPITASPHLSNIPYELIGPEGTIRKKTGLIISKRHIHIPTQLAKKTGISKESSLSLAINNGHRDLIFSDIVPKISENAYLECHIDTDEACAAGIVNKCEGELIIND